MTILQSQILSESIKDEAKDLKNSGEANSLPNSIKTDENSASIVNDKATSPQNQNNDSDKTDPTDRTNILDTNQISEIKNTTKSIRINYKGNRNYRRKSKYSELPDVLNKNLIRSLRRYLAEMFEKADYNINSLETNESQQKAFESFYQEHLKSVSMTAQTISQEDESIVIQILEAFLSFDSTFVNETEELTETKLNIRNILKVYTRKMFRILKKTIGFNKFLAIIEEVGIFDKVIDLYPVFAKSKEAYHNAKNVLLE